MAKKEITEEEKIDKQILDLLMKKGIKTAPEISKVLKPNVWKSSTKIAR